MEFWQKPAIREFLPGNQSWILGFITCLGFLGSSLGSKLAERFWKHHPHGSASKGYWNSYWTVRILFAFAVAALGLADTVPIFILLFVTVYVVLGAGNLMENSLFHQAVENNERASMISLSSLFLRAGGLITSVLGSFLLSGMSLSAVWFMIPLISLILIAVIMFWHNKERGGFDE